MEETGEILGQIEVAVELAPSLKNFIEPVNKESRAFKRYLLEYLNDLAEDLRIPVEISPHVKHCEDINNTSSYQIFINENKCRLPLPAIIPQNVQAKELAGSIAVGIHQNRDLIITVPLSEKIREKWSSEKGEVYLTGLSAEEFHGFLSALVRRGFRVDRGKGITMNSKIQSVWSAEKCFEEAISGSDAISVRLFIRDGGKMTLSAADNHESFEAMLDLMQDGLFYELGINLPEVKMDTDERLEENEFRIQLNDVRFPPIPGLKRDQFLVNETFDRLSLLNLTGERAVNPANGSECAIVQDKSSALAVCKEAGLTAWGPAGFIVLTTSSNIRSNAGNFLTTDIVKFSVDKLSDVFPDLVNTAIKSFDVVTLTRILRELLDEELSIRDLRGILEALLTINITSDADRSKNVVYASHIINLLRIYLKRYISNKYITYTTQSNNNVLVVYLLDKRIEMKIMQEESLNNKERDKLIKAISSELGEVSGKIPVILTTMEIRKKLRTLIEKEFPRVAVLCYQELSPGLNIQPIARITWS